MGGFSEWFVNQYDGSGSQAYNRMNEVVEALSKAKLLNSDLSEEEQKRLFDGVRNVLENWRQSRNAGAEVAADLIIMAGAIVLALPSGGASLTALAATTVGRAILKTLLKNGATRLATEAAIAAALRPGIKELIMQEDYDLFSKEGAADAAIGALSLLLMKVGPQELAKITGLFSKPANAIAKDLSKIGIETAGQKLLEGEIRQFLIKSLLEGGKLNTRELAEKLAINPVLKKMVEGQINTRLAQVGKDAALKAIPVEQMVTRVLSDPKFLSKLETVLEAGMKNSLKDLSKLSLLGQRQLLQTSTGALTGGVDGLLRGVMQWDRSLSPEENIQNIILQTTVATIFGGTLTTALTAPGNIYKSLRRGTEPIAPERRIVDRTNLPERLNPSELRLQIPFKGFSEVELAKITPDKLIESGFKQLPKVGPSEIFIHPRNGSIVKFSDGKIRQITDVHKNTFKLSYDIDGNLHSILTSKDVLITRLSPTRFTDRGWPANRTDQGYKPVPEGHVRLYKVIDSPEEQSVFLNPQALTSKDEQLLKALNPWDSFNHTPAEKLAVLKSKVNHFTLDVPHPRDGRFVYVDVPQAKFIEMRNELLNGAKKLDTFKLPFEYLHQAREIYFSPGNQYRPSDLWAVRTVKPGNRLYYYDYIQGKAVKFGADGRFSIEGLPDVSLIHPERTVIQGQFELLRVGASEQYTKILKQHIDQLPEILKHQLDVRNIKIRVVRSPEDHYTHIELKDRARGWGRNTQNADTQAHFDPHTNEIVIFENNLKSKYLLHALLHESGHILDVTRSGLISKNPQFLRAFAQDILNIGKSRTLRAQLNAKENGYDYYLPEGGFFFSKFKLLKGSQKGTEAARSELFAEMTYEILSGKYSRSNPGRIERLFPTSAAFVRAELEKLGLVKASKV